MAYEKQTAGHTVQTGHSSLLSLQLQCEPCHVVTAASQILHDNLQRPHLHAQLLHAQPVLGHCKLVLRLRRIPLRFQPTLGSIGRFQVDVAFLQT